MKIQTYKEALEKVFIVEQTKDYSLLKMKKAMKLLGNPLKGIKVIHVAGTNGKGSTSKMCFSVLKNAGKGVGCFTSPHLIDIKERFITDDGEITESEFIECLNKVLSLDLCLSFFEKATLLSFLFFQEREVGYAIVEVGFGGLLDSTNVVHPFITAITSIGMDHVDFLGNTLDEISFQKAGIIKPFVPIVYNHINNVIEKTAQEKKSPIIFTTERIETNLVGEHQKRNAAIAFEVCKYLGIESDLIIEGLQKVQHLGRMQSITNNLIIDGAHNEQGLLALKKYINSIQNKYKKVELCFAQKRGKQGEEIMNVFGTDNYNLTLVESNNTQMVEKASVLKKRILDKRVLDEEFTLIKVSTPKEILMNSRKNEDILYVVFGSLYMIGEFLKFKN